MRYYLNQFTMKNKLINQYLDLKSWSNCTSGGQQLKVFTRLLRIDHVLYKRYGYDVSLTRKN